MLARARQLEHLGQLDDAAPVRVGQARVGRQRVEAVFAACRRRRRWPSPRPPLATTWASSASVELLPTQSSTSVGAAPAGELADLGRGVLAGRDRVIRADVERASSSLAGIDVGGDHPRGRERAQDLHRHVAEAADADDHRAACPGRAWSSASLIAWYGVSAASESGAASRGSRSPSGTSSRASGTSMYSAMPPSRPRPPPAAPSCAARSHRVSSASPARAAASAAPRAVDRDRLADLPAA